MPSKPYRVEFDAHARKALARLDKPVQRRIIDALKRLAADPRGQQPQVKPLKGDDAPGAYRLRVGDYRVIYDLYDEKLWVWVVRVGHRSTAYDD